MYVNKEQSWQVGGEQASSHNILTQIKDYSLQTDLKKKPCPSQYLMAYSDQFFNEEDFEAILKVLDEGLLEEEEQQQHEQGQDQTLIQDHNELEDDLSSIVKKVDESVSLHQKLISFSIS